MSHANNIRKAGLMGLLAGIGAISGEVLAAAAKAAEINFPFRRVPLPPMRPRHGRRNRRRTSPRSGANAAPMFIAISRAEDGRGRRYHQCHTRDQALGHHPYIIEHVNGWGQVTRRERLA
jgi:hypothetical protein